MSLYFVWMVYRCMGYRGLTREEVSMVMFNVWFDNGLHGGGGNDDVK